MNAEAFIKQAWDCFMLWLLRFYTPLLPPEWSRKVGACNETGLSLGQLLTLSEKTHYKKTKELRVSRRVEFAA